MGKAPFTLTAKETFTGTMQCLIRNAKTASTILNTLHIKGTPHP